MAFNENTRVKIPAILHLCRLGYNYLSLSKPEWDANTNIFPDIFGESIMRINPDLDIDIKKELDNISLVLDYEDLGKKFYEMLTSTSGIKLIDYNNFENNSFHVVTELPCKNGDEEFRPDITLLINGMPLVFIEVKKPNNRQGILDERGRMDKRFRNKKFRKFINLSQLLVFSNNMEYDTESIVPIKGAFYSTVSYQKADFNCFREEEKFDLTQLLLPESDEIENMVLKDNNLSVIKNSPEFITNKDTNSPTNRLLTSLFSKDRLSMLLKYSFAYVNTEKGIEKHIMRYSQLFATKAIRKTLEKEVKKGIIWHTQGSGKTALAYYNVKYLTDYFQSKSIVPKFYFIVDRIDLMNQAKREFSSRGLIVHTVDSKDELIRDFKKAAAINNQTGQSEITVVNIQKFKEESNVVKIKDYNINIQRVYFLDEVHRSYSPDGSFLANLISSDREAVIIGLTGTPLINSERSSRAIFGDYIHKYYYNSSIADGYTLKLIREGIETNYKILLADTLKQIKLLEGDIEKKLVYAHEVFVEPMLKYIVNDFVKSRAAYNDDSIGAMVVCNSSEQAEKMYELFQKQYAKPIDYVLNEETNQYKNVAEPSIDYYQNRIPKKYLSAALILHDAGTKDERKNLVEDYKDGKIDFLFVFNMLLTGFDAKRLKKLYIGRVIRQHNLLQTLTRVNRPYKDFKYGFVVDFADIRKEFDSTNKAYFEELQSELGDEMKYYSDLFKSNDEIEAEIADIKEKLFHYDLQNAEIFSQQISQIEDRKTVLEIKKALENARNLYNLIRLAGDYDQLQKLDFKKLMDLYNETSRHLDLLNLKDTLANKVDTTNLLNSAIENVIFMFRKITEEELVMADQLKDMLRKTRESLAGNYDQHDAEFVSLYDELKKIFQKDNLDEITQEEMIKNIGNLQLIFDKVSELNRKNNLLKAKYENDEKYARIHKRIYEKGDITNKEVLINEILLKIKQDTDNTVLNNNHILENEGFFNRFMTSTIINTFQNSNINIDVENAKYINNLVVKEYLNEFNGVYA